MSKSSKLSPTAGVKCGKMSLYMQSLHDEGILTDGAYELYRRSIGGYVEKLGLFDKRREEIGRFEGAGYEYEKDFSDVERASHESELDYWESVIRKEIDRSLGLADLKRRLFGVN